MPYKSKELKADNNRRYRETHREELLEKERMWRQMRVICECGCEVSYRKISVHRKQQKHFRAIEARRGILEEKTNPDIANLILEFLG